MAKIPNIFLVGPMGAGKSTIGRAVASLLQLDFYDTDQQIEEKAGADITWIYDIEGEAGYRKREQKIIEELTQKQSIVLATGGGAVVTPANRNALASRGTVIYLKTSLEQQYERTRKDTKRPLLQTDDVHSQIDKLWSERKPLYEEIADHSFNTDGYSVKAVANAIIKWLRQEFNSF